MAICGQTEVLTCAGWETLSHLAGTPVLAWPTSDPHSVIEVHDYEVVQIEGLQTGYSFRHTRGFWSTPLTARHTVYTTGSDRDTLRLTPASELAKALAEAKSAKNKPWHRYPNFAPVPCSQGVEHPLDIQALFYFYSALSIPGRVTHPKQIVFPRTGLDTLNTANLVKLLHTWGVSAAMQKELVDLKLGWPEHPSFASPVIARAALMGEVRRVLEKSAPILAGHRQWWEVVAMLQGDYLAFDEEGWAKPIRGKGNIPEQRESQIQAWDLRMSKDMLLLLRVPGEIPLLSVSQVTKHAIS